jgi:hypothetical protein
MLLEKLRYLLHVCRDVIAANPKNIRLLRELHAGLVHQCFATRFEARHFGARLHRNDTIYRAIRFALHIKR